ncbi:hypothetical protein [Kitasatospora sp. LaBMicrA B282]|uniref:hypothetical protein n=1 Tax=Kitasatospora sp. LaBMicrA B282 TaxID=3420949 RepID=UPI003D0D430E
MPPGHQHPDGHPDHSDHPGRPDHPDRLGPEFATAFGQALRETGQATPTPVLELLATGAERRGRRRKRQRTVLASAAAVAVLAAGGAFVAPQLTGTRSTAAPASVTVTSAAPNTAATPGPAATPSTAPSPGTATSPTATPSTPTATSPTATATPTAPASAPASASASASAPPSLGPVDDATMLELFRARLPAGLQLSQPQSQGARTAQGTTAHPSSVAPPGMAMASFTITDGQGAASTMIQVYRQPVSSQGQADTSCPPASPPQGGPCTVRPDGSTLLITDRGLAPSSGEQFQPWLRSAKLQLPTGLVVTVATENAPDQGRAPADRATVPLTVDQLSSIALDPVWLAVGAQLPPA